MKKKSSSPSDLRSTSILFLTSHGLQTPLSAIRFGCGRLKKNAENFSPEERKLLLGIESEAKLLSRMFDWLLLLAKTEEGIHVPDVQEVYVRDFLVTSLAPDKLLRPLTLSVDCPKDLLLQTDRTLFSSILHAIVLAASADGTVDTAKITVEMNKEKTECVLTLHADIRLSLAEEEDEGGTGSKRRIAGGVSGFLLAVASSFTTAIGGELLPEESKEEEGLLRSLRLRLPAHVPLSSLLR